MYSNIKKVGSFITTLFFFVSPLFVFAGNCPSDPGSAGGNCPPPVNTIDIKIENPLKGGIDTIPGFLGLVINNIVLPIGGIVAVLYIIYAGFLMVTARGNEAKLKDAKAALLYAAIGTAILLGAWVISQVIGNTICSIASC
jgi:hypothetical protein